MIRKSQRQKKKKKKREKNSCQWQLLSLCGTGSESAFTLLRFTKSTKAPEHVCLIRITKQLIGLRAFTRMINTDILQYFLHSALIDSGMKKFLPIYICHFMFVD